MAQNKIQPTISPAPCAITPPRAAITSGAGAFLRWKNENDYNYKFQKSNSSANSRK